MKPADIQAVIDRLQEELDQRPFSPRVTLSRAALAELIGSLETLRDLMEQDAVETRDLPAVTSILE